MFFPRRTLRHALSLLVGLGLTVGLLTPASAADGNPATPGNLTGYGFDQCLAPTQKAMTRWMNYSPFLAVGIYISGNSRACRSQPNLTPDWVATQLRQGWRLLPITLGPQASCNPRFPRYKDDPLINATPGANNRYGKARQQGRAEAVKAVATADALGIVAGSTLWYDLEGFDSTQTRCRESALAFLSGWSFKIRDLGYVSGVYSSAGSGIKVLDDARVKRPEDFNLPDRIWIARWDNVADTSTSYIRPDGWLPGNRMKQYMGGHDEVWGGVRINIDRNFLDLGTGSVAPEETHCDGVRVDWRGYPPLTVDATRTGKVLALQCLLQEKGLYAGNVNGVYNPRLITAVNAWQEAHDLPVADLWSRKAWVTLLADGWHPVSKIGSAGPQVRRLQRALNAANHLRTDVTGVVDDGTVAAIRAWQSAVGLEVTGVMSKAHWDALLSGAR